MPSTLSAKVSPSRVKLPDSSHYYPLLKALKSSCSSTEGGKQKEVYRDISLEEAIRRVVDREVTSVILDDSILVVYSVGYPWYADKLILSEEMVLKFNPSTSSLKDVCDLLDDLAEQHNVSCTVVGTALSRNDIALARKYQRSGFVNDGTMCLVKRRDNGIHQA